MLRQASMTTDLTSLATMSKVLLSAKSVKLELPSLWDQVRTIQILLTDKPRQDL